jgi:hypothetical protein
MGSWTFLSAQNCSPKAAWNHFFASQCQCFERESLWKTCSEDHPKCNSSLSTSYSTPCSILFSITPRRRSFHFNYHSQKTLTLTAQKTKNTLTTSGLSFVRKCLKALGLCPAEFPKKFCFIGFQQKLKVTGALDAN